MPQDDHEIIFVSGPPKCGKSYWVNQYVKKYKDIFDNRKVFLFTRLQHDVTLEKDIDNYIKIFITDSFITDPFKLEDFTNSLCIFDDIESSEFPKATQKAFNLLDDICRNGRHHNISCILCHQETRMGKKTKPLLTMITSLVIFPKTGNIYQMSHVLKEQIGMSKSQINKVMSLSSRWVVINRACPQYIMYDKGVYLLNKDVY